MSNALTSTDVERVLEDHAERVAKNTAPSPLREDGTRKDGAEIHPDDCGCIRCSHERYGCAVCGNKGPECTPKKCDTDPEEEDVPA